MNSLSEIITESRNDLLSLLHEIHVEFSNLNFPTRCDSAHLKSGSNWSDTNGIKLSASLN